MQKMKFLTRYVKREIREIIRLVASREVQISGLHKPTDDRRMTVNLPVGVWDKAIDLNFTNSSILVLDFPSV